jgi:hypothetical protein
MENLVEEIESRDTKFYTPESIAWDLLVGESKDIDPEKKGKLICFIENENKEGNKEENKEELTNSDLLTYNYEILITIFMELLFNMAKLNFYFENENNDFIPDYKKFNIDAFFSLIQDKFKILGFMAFVDSEKMEGDKEWLIDLINQRYCRVVLRYHDDDEHFEINNVSKDVYYHMKLNGLNKKKYKKLGEIYSVVFLNDNVYKIYFEQI